METDDKIYKKKKKILIGHVLKYYSTLPIFLIFRIDLHEVKNNIAGTKTCLFMK